MFPYRSTVLAVINQKGGVGKTTCASTIAEYAAIREHKDVLIVDLDMQCNSSDYWVGMEADAQAVGGQLPPKHPDYDGDPSINERSSVADIFYGKSVLPYSTYISRAKGFQNDVDIMVGHPELLERINTEYDNASGRIATAIIERLGELLHSEEVAETYSLVILDLGPSRNPVFRAAIRAATHAIIPFEPEEKSLQGINAMMQAIASENYSRPPGAELKLIGMLPNKVRIQTRLHKETLAELRSAPNLSNLVFPEESQLPHSTAFPERDVKGIRPRSILDIEKSHPARQAAEAVGAFVFSRL